MVGTKSLIFCSQNAHTTKRRVADFGNCEGRYAAVRSALSLSMRHILRLHRRVNLKLEWRIEVADTTGRLSYRNDGKAQEQFFYRLPIPFPSSPALPPEFAELLLVKVSRFSVYVSYSLLTNFVDKFLSSRASRLLEMRGGYLICHS